MKVVGMKGVSSFMKPLKLVSISEAGARFGSGGSPWVWVNSVQIALQTQEITGMQMTTMMPAKGCRQIARR